ncbi:hypothetical protein HK102_013842 [Quaeritorhiza haematococci]|nr:hypothetical protein HK102_013842 [Quaeritorhiza haematococci]
METDDEDDLFDGPYVADLDAGPQEPLREPDRDLAIDKSFKPLSLVEGSWVWAIDPNRGGNFIYAVATRFDDDEIQQTYSVSVSEYYERCGFEKARLKRERWLRKDRVVKRAVEDLAKQTYCTASLQVYLDYLRTLVPNLYRLVDFYGQKRVVA